MNYRSFGDLAATVSRNLHRVPRPVDLVCAVPRSGLLPGTLIALHLNVPLTTPSLLLSGEIVQGGERDKLGRESQYLQRARTVLVVDDSVAGGGAMTAVRQQLAPLASVHEFRFLAVYGAPAWERHVDMIFDLVDLPRVFEWNLFHHPYVLRHACCDIDGVLCRDPTEGENDDGSEYMAFLREVEPLWVPSVPLGCLVTSRLEKYRALTEEWLSTQGVKYDELVMLDLPSKAERLRLGCHAQFKSDQYALRPNAMLFIESSSRQAHEILKRTRRPVFCTDTSEMLSAEPLRPSCLSSLRKSVEASRWVTSCRLTASLWSYTTKAYRNCRERLRAGRFAR